MTNYYTLTPYLHREIEDMGGYTSKDYRTFERKYRNFIRNICKHNGYELTKFMGGHYEFSCFVKGNDKYVYVSISDVRYWHNEWYRHILIRTATSDTDYHGGSNNYTTLQELENKINKMLGKE